MSPTPVRSGTSLVLSLLMLCWMTAATGCVAVAAAAGAGAGVAYVQDELRATVDASPEEVVEAARRALDDMDIAVLSHEFSDVDGQINARTARDRRVAIRVNRETDTTSRIGIRVGLYGNRDISQRIYDGIKEQL